MRPARRNCFPDNHSAPYFKSPIAKRFRSMDPKCAHDFYFWQCIHSACNTFILQVCLLYLYRQLFFVIGCSLAEFSSFILSGAFIAHVGFTIKKLPKLSGSGNFYFQLVLMKLKYSINTSIFQNFKHLFPLLHHPFLHSFLIFLTAPFSVHCSITSH